MNAAVVTIEADVRFSATPFLRSDSRHKDHAISSLPHETIVTYYSVQQSIY